MPLNLSGLLKTAGAGFQGFGQDKQRILGEETDRKAAERQSMLDLVAESDRQSQTKRQALLDAANLRHIGAQTDKLLAPPPPKPTRYEVVNGQRINVDTGEAEPIKGFVAPPPPAPNLSFQTLGGQDGQPAKIVALDPRTGDQVREIGDAKPGIAQRPTEGQMRANLVTPRAEQAAQDLMQFYDSGAPIKTLAQRIPVVGNFVMNEEEQRMVQAAEVVASAVLRLESGAAITESEVQSYARQLLPAPGDTPEVLQQKRAALGKSLEAMRAQSTMGAKPPDTSGDPEFDALMAKYAKPPL